MFIMKKFLENFLKINLIAFSSLIPMKNFSQTLENGLLDSCISNYDSLKIHLLDRNKDKKIDKLFCWCYFKQNKIFVQSKDDDFDGYFEFGNYIFIDNEKYGLTNLKKNSLDQISQGVGDFSEGKHEIYKK